MSWAMPIRSAIASMIRWLAWCGTKRATSAGLDLGQLQRGVGRVDGGPDGLAEDLLAAHDHSLAMIDVEEVDERAVHPDIPPEQRARTAHRFEDHRARPVPKEKGVRAVFPVEGPGHGFSPDEEHFTGTGRQHAGGRDQAVGEACARRVEIDRSSGNPECTGNGRRGAGHHLVRGRRAQQDEVDLLGLRLRRCERLAARLYGQRRGGPEAPGGMESGSGETKGPVAVRRVRTPERSTIHSSLVSSIDSRSLLVTTVGGSAVPHPVMTQPRSLTNDQSPSGGLVERRPPRKKS